ncbi:MAG: hypothetical protein GDYSWBUE_001077 [Candidatus Fervidibacterota bacterium]
MRWACAKARKYMSLMVDGEITQSARKWCEAHMRECIACRAEWSALQLICEAMRTQDGSERVKAPVDVYECIAPKLAELESAQTVTQRSHLKWLPLGFAFALTVLFGLCWLGIRSKQVTIHDIAHSDVLPVYVHAHLLGAEEAQALPSPVLSASIVNFVSLR